MPSKKKLAKYHARLANLRADAQSMAEGSGRRQIYESEIADVKKRIAKEKSKPGKPH